MATARDLNFIYTTIDRMFRLSIGEQADFSGAKYDGNFSLTLEAAQHRKHAFIADEIRLAAGSRVLDLGCGWGPFLAFARARDAVGVGVTLSQGQAAACRRQGLDVHIADCRTVTPAMFGRFDALVSIGAFEHFCSREEFAGGRQEAVYRNFFVHARGVVPAGGRFYLQTMVFGRRMIPPDQISLEAPRLSDGHVLALLQATFPGSWLPSGLAQITDAAAPHFRVVSSESGRLDYIQTIREWRRRFAEFTVAKLAVKLTLVPRYLLSRDFRNAFASGISANTICFERELLDHFRIVLEAI
ncbi:MAG TPA: class I SAM-dependent methyltransferase [Gemmatimonadales bacterium]|nr:class I SAM-dependent methyltransferase [Gemmatimonadales bacterium]